MTCTFVSKFVRLGERKSVKEWSSFRILFLVAIRWLIRLCFLLNLQIDELMVKKTGLNFVDFFFQVTGKAVMLDEIINYVQSLQRQVEVNFRSVGVHFWRITLFILLWIRFLIGIFVICWCHSQFLSMKLATVNPRLDFNMETLLSKDVSWSCNRFWCCAFWSACLNFHV